MPTESKKRGRPKKIIVPEQENVIVNEHKKEIKMSTEEITMEDVHQRWQEIFSNYNSLGINNIMEAWGSVGINSYNPFLENQRIKRATSPATKTSKKDLQDATLDPMNHEDVFRKTSINLYLTNYIYNLLVNTNRNVPKYYYYYYPKFLNTQSKKDDIIKEGQIIDKALNSFNPQLTLKTISTQVYLEGKSSYLVRESHNKDDVEFFVVQKLDSDMVKLTGWGSTQRFRTSFNMMVLLQPGYSSELYPEFIQKVWKEMNSSGFISTTTDGRKEVNLKAKIPSDHTFEVKNDTYMYWVELPQDLCYTFYSDGATAISAPDAIGLFSDFNDLGDYRWLQASLLSKGVNSVITAEVPFDKNAKGGTDATIISPDVVLGYQKYFSNTVSGNIFPFFAPFTNFDMHNIENQPEAMDILYNRTRDLIATSGNAALLPITDKPSIASVKAAESLQASKNEYLTSQFESFLNNVINSVFGFKNKWKITLWGDTFYAKDEIKQLQSLIKDGYSSLIPRLLSAYNISLNDYSSIEKYLKFLGIEIKSQQDKQKEEDQNDKTISNGEKGRNPIADEDIENDNTAISKDMGNNVSEIK